MTNHIIISVFYCCGYFKIIPHFFVLKNDSAMVLYIPHNLYLSCLLSIRYDQGSGVYTVALGCYSTCRYFSSCLHNDLRTSSCSHYYDVGLSCTNDCKCLTIVEVLVILINYIRN